MIRFTVFIPRSAGRHTSCYSMVLEPARQPSHVTFSPYSQRDRVKTADRHNWMQGSDNIRFYWVNPPLNPAIQEAQLLLRNIQSYANITSITILFRSRTIFASTQTKWSCNQQSKI